MKYVFYKVGSEKKDENLRRLERGAKTALGLVGVTGAIVAAKKRPNYIKTKFRGDLPLLKNMSEAGKKLKGKIKELNMMKDDYLKAFAVAKHGPVDDPKVFKALSDHGIIGLASLSRRSAAKK